MATTAPGQSSVKPRGKHRDEGKRQESQLDQDVEALAFDDDPTEYPDYEPVGRGKAEHLAILYLVPVLIRYQAQRGIKCYTSADTFFYWSKGDNKRSVSPDIYILPGMDPKVGPAAFAGSKDESCWKTWIHHVVPSFALEVKAWKNPRKDELQAPARHDALGTKELIVFDPFYHRRRGGRKRFVVYRRDAQGALVIVQATNDDRVFSTDLDAFIVAQGEGEEALLRLGLGPRGDTLLLHDHELIELQEQQTQQQAQRANAEARRADEEARRADEATRMAREAAQRAAELEAELASLRAGSDSHRKR
jgi:hypothetical protein